MTISATDVKNLREKTGAGMMDCKKALAQTNGDMEAAVDFLRTKGLAQAAKKASRIAAEGFVGVESDEQAAVLVEVNCETDFVAKGDDFKKFVKDTLSKALNEAPPQLEALRELVKEATTELTLKCGEKVDVRRYERLVLDSGKGEFAGHYNHGGKIGVLVHMSTDKGSRADEHVREVAKDLAMHVAAADPKFVREDEIDEGFRKREADIYTAQLKEQGKSDQMIPKIVEGKLKKLAKEVCLLEQKFVKNPDLSIQKYIGEKAKQMDKTMTVLGFLKFNLGEGIERKQDNLAEEVAKLTGSQQSS
ncbi:MAG: translation elongation factor Ts [Bacteriovoracales bacterium]|nr:translation elongation factor Ts [Bacteriovoracales bacterium]